MSKVLPHAKSDHCALARANRVFYTDEKHIRVENTVMVNTKPDVGVLYRIADCVRMCF